MNKDNLLHRSVQKHAPFLLVVASVVIFCQCLSTMVTAQDLRFMISDRHERAAGLLRVFFEEMSITVDFKILPGPDLAKGVSNGEADLFSVSLSEIAELQEVTDIDLRQFGQTIGIADIKKLHLITLAEYGIKDIEQIDKVLVGKGVSLGPKNTIHHTHAIASIQAQRMVSGQQTFKCDRDGGSLKCTHNLLNDQPTELLSRNLKVFFVFGAGTPETVLTVAAKDELEIVTIPGDVVEKMKRIKPKAGYVHTTIAMNLYEEGAYYKVSTVGIPIIVAATPKAEKAKIALISDLLLFKYRFLNSDVIANTISQASSYIPVAPGTLEMLKR